MIDLNTLDTLTGTDLDSATRAFIAEGPADNALHSSLTS